ncbi:hypothetical protein L596_010512 [Steinernema carpocapsae]|uniref:C-type lectin domain-containing protein n=1 Tax=Steinernema carpocapsae TaxID=34508 RepID=A0A4U5PJX2_STECR|nr:hypothetical protein L596_010512 [Steinernema carpocapsae]
MIWLLFLSSLLWQHSEALDECPIGAVYSPSSMRCFQLVYTPTGFLEAVHYCRIFQSNLVSVLNKGDLDVLGDLLSEQIGLHGDTYPGLWIGGHNLMDFTEWKWTDGHSFNQSMVPATWQTGQPYNCLAIQDRDNMEFIPNKCCNEKAFVCAHRSRASQSSKNPYKKRLKESLATVTPLSTTSSSPSCPSPPLCPSGTCSYTCDPEWTRFPSTNFCYRAIDNHDNDWFQSETLCQTYGAHLASISSLAENLFLGKLADAFYVGTSDKHEKAFTGLHYSNKTKTFQWSDGCPFSYANWEEGEPNNYGNSNEDCVEMILSLPGKEWNDVTCSYDTRTILCKKPAKIQP